MLALLMLCTAMPALARNLVANPDFTQGAPGADAFAWQLNSAPGQAVARLSDTERFFTASLGPGSRTRLYALRPQ